MACHGPQEWPCRRILGVQKISTSGRYKMKKQNKTKKTEELHQSFGKSTSIVSFGVTQCSVAQRSERLDKQVDQEVRLDGSSPRVK